MWCYLAENPLLIIFTINMIILLVIAYLTRYSYIIQIYDDNFNRRTLTLYFRVNRYTNEVYKFDESKKCWIEIMAHNTPLTGGEMKEFRKWLKNKKNEGI